jgi:hypothetical protein
MLRPLDKVWPFKVDPSISELSLTRPIHDGSLQICRGRIDKSDSSRRPIPREDVSTFCQCG